MLKPTEYSRISQRQLILVQTLYFLDVLKQLVGFAHDCGLYLLFDLNIIQGRVEGEDGIATGTIKS